MDSSAGRNVLDFIHKWLREGFWFRLTQVFVLLGLAIGIFLLIELIFTENRYLEGILVRLAPLIGFGTIVFAQLNYLISKIVKKHDLSKLLPKQLYFLSATWMVLNLFWILGTIKPLEDILIFKIVVIVCVSAYIFVIFTLDYQLTTDFFSRFVMALSLTLYTPLLFWISNHFIEMSEFTILTLALFPTLIVQSIFLGLIVFREQESQYVTIANFVLNIKTITIYLSFIATILVLLAILFQMSVPLGFGELSNMVGNTFTLDSEMNIPSYFSSAILLMSAGLLFLVFKTRKNKRGPYTGHWGFLSVVFILLSLDELFSFHERIIGPVRKIVKVGGIFSYEWVILAIPLVLIFSISYSKFLFHLPPKSRILFTLAALLFIGGTLGGEMLSGWYASNFGEGDSNYIMLTIFEETLEMSGIIVFIHSILWLLHYDYTRNKPRLNLQF
jgi:hypothetical protein